MLHGSVACAANGAEMKATVAAIIAEGLGDYL
jgi:hypothetical protein